MQILREDEVKMAAPSKWLLLMELRAPLERIAYQLQARALRRLPRGDGRAVLVVPGFGTTDASTRAMRALLRDLGYAAYGWGQGRNLGMNGKVREALSARLRELFDRHGKVTLVGWSLGGVFVREFARHAPQLVRRVITLGSPFNGHPDANNVMPLYRLAQRGKPIKSDWDGFQKRRLAPPVPCVAIHSKTDGVVHWECSLEEADGDTRNVEVPSSHFGLVVNPAALRALVAEIARD